jgi:hypothetical protein
MLLFVEIKMITQDELEMFIDGLIQPHCNEDSCPIDFGDRNDSK